MPRTSQPSTSYSYSASSDTSSFLSGKNKALSPRPDFNPFSPLSPELELDDEDQGALFSMEVPNSARHVYTRKELLDIARKCRKQGWTKPPSMGSLESWFGIQQRPNTNHEDPAIVSSGAPPNRRGGGFGEGFGYGGGIGGKGLSRGGRHNGMRRTDQDHSQSKELVGGAMGKFAVRQSGERMKLGGDEPNKPKDDWRREKPPHQRQERRTWNNRHEEDAAEPAWMDDQPEQDPAIVQIQDDSLVQFIPGEDRIAAHKRAMNTGAHQGSDGYGRKPLVGFFGGNAPDPVKVAKPVKEYNAANYLLRSKDKVEHEKSEAKDAGGSSRFQRFFGNPTQGRFGAETSEIPLPPAAISPQPVTGRVESSFSPSGPPALAMPVNYPSMQPTSMRSPEPVVSAEASHQGRLMNMLASSLSPAPRDPTPYRQTPPPGPGYRHQTSISPPPSGQTPYTNNMNLGDYRPDTQFSTRGAHVPPPPIAPVYTQLPMPQYTNYYDGPPPPQHYQQGYLPPTHPDMSRHNQPPPPPPGFPPYHIQQQQQQQPQWSGPPAHAPQYAGPPPPPPQDSSTHLRNIYAMLNGYSQPPN